MKKICIFGAGGFAREVFWLAGQCGWWVSAFIDVHPGPDYQNVPIAPESYFDSQQHKAVVAVGNPLIREKIATKIADQYGSEVFATLISPSAELMASNIEIGYGSVICGNCILTCDIKLGPHAQLNLSTTIGHDTNAGAFFTTAPGVHISGKVIAGERVYFGTNASAIEGLFICDDVIVGAGACVAKNIVEPGTYVGIPAKKLEKKNG